MRLHDFVEFTELFGFFPVDFTKLDDDILNFSILSNLLKLKSRVFLSISQRLTLRPEREIAEGTE